MTALIVIGIIILVVLLIMCIPVGVDVNFENGELRLCAKMFGVLLQILPKEPASETKPKEKKEKPKKEKKPKKPKKEKKESDSGKKKGIPFDFTADEIIELLKRVFKALGRFGRRIYTDRLMLHYKGGGSDPYQTAVTFGYVNAGISSLMPFARDAINIRDYDITTDVDFTLEKTQVDFGIAVSLYIGSVFRMLFAIIFGAAAIFIRNRIRVIKEKRQRKKALKHADMQQEPADAA